MTSTPKVALVTGSSSGIGKITAQALAAAGYAVVGTSRDASRAPSFDGITFIDLDVTDESSARDAVENVVTTHGRLDLVVNNAGIGLLGAAEENSIAQSQAVFDTNVFGVMRMVRAALPHMRERRTGRIINISSIFGKIPAPLMASYAATKYAVEGYTESLDHEIREHGLRALVVGPAVTRTSFEGNSTAPDEPLPVYAHQRQLFADVLKENFAKGDDPRVVADTVVKAATARKPRFRYAAGSTARQVDVLRRLAPASVFDSQVRKLNKLP